MRIADALCCAALVLTHPAFAQGAPPSSSGEGLSDAAAKAEQDLRQTFTNLQFEEFGPAPVRGPIYQAIAGGRVLYFAPQSQHLLFAAVYDKNGLNLTAMAQDESARKRLGAINLADALVIGPAGAPKVIEFTDPDCPYCQALDRYWNAKAAEGKPVQRFVYFVSGIHPDAAAKAEHILCSADRLGAFKAIYAGARPAALAKCKAGADKVARDAATVRKMGISGTPTMFIDGKLISGFQQAELEAFLDAKKGSP
ncbi:MAG: DsbC family protein [Sphingopyxis terrae]|nr:DsbC family protein [Sphingopyxis terrae]